jgi:DUF971 family protein
VYAAAQARAPPPAATIAVAMSSPQTTAVKIDLQKDRRLLVQFADGRTIEYPLGLLRAKCPCASCRTLREQMANQAKRRSLTVLGDAGRYAGPMVVVNAELVGNYAIRLDWADDHGSGIYSFAYLREIEPDQ